MQRELETTRRRRHEYLLSGLIYLEYPDDKHIVRMTCSTSNPNRPGGGTSYYRITRTSISFLCDEIDNQSEWQDRRRKLRHNLEAAEKQTAYHISHLDDALHIISRIGILFKELDKSNRKKLLREIVERVVVDPSGTVIRVELLAPFSYLNHIRKRVSNDDVSGVEQENKIAGLCASYSSIEVSLVGPEELPTPFAILCRTCHACLANHMRLIRRPIVIAKSRLVPVSPIPSRCSNAMCS